LLFPLRVQHERTPADHTAAASREALAISGRHPSQDDLSTGICGFAQETPHCVRRTLLRGMNFSRPFGTCSIRAWFPTLKRWAIFVWTLRDWTPDGREQFVEVPSPF